MKSGEIMRLWVTFIAVLSAVHGFRVRPDGDSSARSFRVRTQIDIVSSEDSSDFDSLPVHDSNTSASLFNVTHGNHNISSGDDMAWGQGALSNTSTDNDVVTVQKNVTMTDGEAETNTRPIGTSAFLFVTIPIIALVAAVASKYGKSPNENNVSRTPRDTDDNYSSHRMITTASEEERDSNIEDRDREDRDIEDRAEEAFGGTSLERKLFVQVYKPHRDQSELTAIKNGLAMALHDRGDRNSPAIGAGRYNLTGRHSYTPDDDSEHNSPFDEPSIPI